MYLQILVEMEFSLSVKDCGLPFGVFLWTFADGIVIYIQLEYEYKTWTLAHYQVLNITYLLHAHHVQGGGAATRLNRCDCAHELVAVADFLIGLPVFIIFLLGVVVLEDQAFLRLVRDTDTYSVMEVLY